MTDEQFKGLGTGDIIRHKSEPSRPFVVMETDGHQVIIIWVQSISNPPEWDIIFKAFHVRPPTIEHGN